VEKNIYIGRQPILDRDNNTFAYALLYRNVDNDNYIADNRSATASLLVSILNQFGMKKIIGEHPAFIIIDGSFLLQDMVHSIPKEKFVFSLLEDITLSKPIIEIIKNLHREGYRFAINDTYLTEEVLAHFQPVLHLIDYIKIDTTRTDITRIASLRESFNVAVAKLVATKVETHADFEAWAKEPIDFFQGYYFSRPKMITETVFAPEKTAVMQIWKLIMNDSPVKEITEAFEQNPTLSLQLLRYINSGMFHFKSPIKSIAQVITLVGRLPLLQWLLLLINAKEMESASQASPMQTMLINRIEVMLGLYRVIHPKAQTDESEVYFVGLLSLIDILMGVSIRTVVDELNVDPIVCDAIFEQKGELGDILVAARSIENFDTASIERFLNKYEIEMDDIVNLTLQSIEKVNAFETTL
jgi:EAL and modified HD-GYP domain-containing signal transduction protein